MNNILSEFQNEMELLKFYVDFQNKSYKNQSKLEKVNPDSVFNTLTISKIKQFDFNSHIISIYGAYENFIEQLLVKYLTEICLITNSYDLLPLEIQKNNVNKTLEIIKKLDYRKNRNIKPEKVIEILHKNINENSSTININAFKNHNANFRISVVETYFSEIGIKNISSLVRQYDPLKTYLKNNISDYASKKSSIIFQPLEHVCDLRNDIAHGVSNIQLINKTILFEYIDFMNIYSTALFELINDNYLMKIYEQNNDEIESIKVFSNQILCLNTKGKLINRNSKILVKSENHFPNVYLTNIEDIQQDNKSINNTEVGKNIEIGIKLDKKIKDTMNFKLITE
ncbi:HEPN domain-containing protein [Psychroflexus aestuariivivens]|uniref:HEPN domain-containing protein n=1 Tax=Psychroflexus aestuariivivens TaxID=1795040 RepID=UPI000FD787EC|nr:HEPN domain-containing protein [Psychroflexus aestuariivivens]